MQCEGTWWLFAVEKTFSIHWSHWCSHQHCEHGCQSCIFAESQTLFVIQFKFTETSRTVAWPRSRSHMKQNIPSSLALRLQNISLSHGCKLTVQQCFEVALGKFVFPWRGWEFERIMIHPEDQGRLFLYIRTVLCPTRPLKTYIFIARA